MSLFSGLTAGQIYLLSRDETAKHIKSILSAKNLPIVWAIIEDEFLVVIALSIQLLNEFLPLVKDCLPVFSLVANNIDKRVLQDGIVRQLHDKYPDMVRIDVIDENVFVACVDYLGKDVCAELKLYIDKHSTTSIFMEMNPGRFGYILVYRTSDFVKVESEFSEVPVEIDVVHEHRKKGFRLKGPKFACQDALSKLAMISDSVFESVLPVDWPGFEKFIENDKIKAVLTRLQLQNQCLLKVHINGYYGKRTSDPLNSTFTCLANCKIENTALSFNLGDIMEVKSDALVVPVSSCPNENIGPEIVNRGKLIFRLKWYPRSYTLCSKQCL